MAVPSRWQLGALELAALLTRSCHPKNVDRDPERIEEAEPQRSAIPFGLFPTAKSNWDDLAKSCCLAEGEPARE